MEKVIFHCDLNSFYASVELLDFPELRHRPVAVCGDPHSRQGVVLAKNEPAKKAGVATGQTVWQARRLSPDLVLLPAHGEKYRHWSQQVNQLYLEYTDLVEPFGVDESWLDVTGCLHLFQKSPEALADEIRCRCREEFGLTLSIGVSFNKIFAKLGSDYKKPDATTLITPENYQEIVWPLPVGDLLYVGAATQKALKQYGITTIGQLANFDPKALETILGKQGTMVYHYARGEDSAPVASFYQEDPPKSLGQGLTFPKNLEGPQAVRSGIIMLSDHVALRLRLHQLKCCGVQLTLRDPFFNNKSRQIQLENPTHLAWDISNTAFSLAEAHWNFATPVRAMSVTAINLLPSQQAGEQLSLFRQEDPVQEKRRILEETTDAIRQKYGRHSIGPASSSRKEKRKTIAFSLDQSAD